MSSQVVIFSLGQEEYGMPIEVVREITQVSAIRPIPKAPDYVKGLINIRGSAIPLIDLHKRFGINTVLTSKAGQEEAGQGYALITEISGNLIGYAVDLVKEVRVLENILPPPPLVTAPFIGGVVNLPDRIIMHVVPERILEVDELQGLRAIV